MKSNQLLPPFSIPHCGLGLIPFFLFVVSEFRKDPVFGALVQGSLDQHLPRAKLFSVCTTLALVCLFQYLTSQSFTNETSSNTPTTQRSDDDILQGGGVWSRMATETTTEYSIHAEEPLVSRLFLYVALPYSIIFGIIAAILQFNPSVALMDPSRDGSSFASINQSTADSFYWQVVGYCFYATVESFGSIAVATFWSFCNSTLTLDDAENFYGIIVAVAQVGAILGSTMVTLHIWSSITLIVTACLILVMAMVVMHLYNRRYPHRSQVAYRIEESHDTTTPKTFWMGIQPILRYRYVQMILGVSCLYEVSLTCLNYQMTILGYRRYEQDTTSRISFKQFMGHYGQMVNMSSLFFSAVVFPTLIRRAGLRWTIRIFPTLLLAVNLLAFGILPGNLTLLFAGLSILKAMTYSIHDPAKEILYIPCSATIQMQSKFWIDVVGDRLAKAIGSSINQYAGSVEQSVRVASAPSLLTAATLWLICWMVGNDFDHLVTTNTTIGQQDDDDDHNNHGDFLEKDYGDERDLIPHPSEDGTCNGNSLDH